MKTILITGASGYTGLHLIDLLLTKSDTKIIGTYVGDIPQNYKDKITWEECNLIENSSIGQILLKYKPDQIYHLAGIVGVGELQKNPAPGFNLNVIGTLNLLQAIVNNELKCRLLDIGSVEEYGKVDSLPIIEEMELKPITLYGLTKKMQEELCEYYAEKYNLEVVHSRTFHSFGPRQPLGHVFPDFASQIVTLKDKDEKIIKVGNLSAIRDFLDIRDIVNGYYLIMEKGVANEKYNICSGESHSIQSLLDIMLTKVDYKINIEIDPNKLRPVDVPEFLGDNSKLKSLGWERTFSIDKTIEDIFLYTRGVTES